MIRSFVVNFSPAIKIITCKRHINDNIFRFSCNARYAVRSVVAMDCEKISRKGIQSSDGKFSLVFSIEFISKSSMKISMNLNENPRALFLKHLRRVERKT
jgi:hypothetical protein